MGPIETGTELLEKIKLLGDFKAYIVGGTPRDIIMGQKSNDVDISTNCPMNILEKSFRTYSIGRARNCGTLCVLYRGEVFEVTQFRADGEYSDGRRPDSIKIVKNFKEDAARRDFTINSLSMDDKGTITDHFDGISDIHLKTVRTVGDPIERFKEDHLRMIRAARFASMDGFHIEEMTRRAIRKLFRLVNKVKPERIHLELIKAASKPGPQFARFITMLDDL